MRLGELRRQFLKKAGALRVDGTTYGLRFWRSCVNRSMTGRCCRIFAQLDIVPPRPDADYVGVNLRRLLAMTSSDPDVDLEAGLYVTARWSSAVNVGSEIIAAAGKGPSSYEYDPAPDVEQFAQLVERLPAVQRLSGADVLFLSFEAYYKRPTVPD